MIKKLQRNFEVSSPELSLMIEAVLKDFGKDHYALSYEELQALQEAILNKSYKFSASEIESSKLPIFIRPKDALVQHALGTLLNHKFRALNLNGYHSSFFADKNAFFNTIVG